MKRLALFIIMAGILAVPAASQAAVPHYRDCPPIYHRFDQHLLAKPGVPCWLARTVEVAQPSGGQYLAGWHWTVDSQQLSGRWWDCFWRGREYWPAVCVVHFPSA